MWKLNFMHWPIAERYISIYQHKLKKRKGTREASPAIRLRRFDYGLNTHVSFVDSEKAFDKVKWQKIMITLKNKGLDYRDIRVIFKLYDHQKQ